MQWPQSENTSLLYLNTDVKMRDSSEGSSGEMCCLLIIFNYAKTVLKQSFLTELCLVLVCPKINADDCYFFLTFYQTKCGLKNPKT